MSASNSPAETGGREVAVDPLERLAGFRTRISDLREQLHLEITGRDQIIVTAVDEGHTQEQVGRAAGVSPGRVIAILAASHQG